MDGQRMIPQRLDDVFCAGALTSDSRRWRRRVPAWPQRPRTLPEMSTDRARDWLRLGTALTGSACREVSSRAMPAACSGMVTLPIGNSGSILSRTTSACLFTQDRLRGILQVREVSGLRRTAQWIKANQDPAQHVSRVRETLGEDDRHTIRETSFALELAGRRSRERRFPDPGQTTDGHQRVCPICPSPRNRSSTQARSADRPTKRVGTARSAASSGGPSGCGGGVVVAEAVTAESAR